MNLFELCHYNMDTDENKKKKIDSWNPCLRKSNHKGKHEHNKFCNNSSCSCGSILKRMSKTDKFEYELLKEEKERFDELMNKVLEKNKVEEQDG